MHRCQASEESQVESMDESLKITITKLGETAEASKRCNLSRHGRTGIQSNT